MLENECNPLVMELFEKKPVRNISGGSYIIFNVVIYLIKCSVQGQGYHSAPKRRWLTGLQLLQHIQFWKTYPKPPKLVSVQDWKYKNKLKWNADKTEFLLIYR